ncbi:hypothetical protein NA57DRAFT_18202, partial [Rhizodiscina lignyota]
PSKASPAPELNLKRGELAPTNLSFCPVLPLSKYCYKYIGHENSQPVAERFFDKGQFWQREWDLFYVYHPESDQLVALIPDYQFQDLLDEINKAFPKLGLYITGWQREHGLVTRFPPYRDTRPRYLGRSTSKDEYTNLTDNAPDASFRPAGEKPTPIADADTMEAFQDMVEACTELNKNKGKGSKEKKEMDRMMESKSSAEQVKRAQAHVGLGPKEEHIPIEQRPVFICFDVEAYERDHKVILEVGIATLDASELADVQPSGRGENWWEHIHARHFRIAEHMHHVNTEFVQGCPERFEFGQTEVVPLAEISSSISSIFNKSADRKIVLVGHNIQGDIKYLAELGINPLDIPQATEDSPRGLLEVLDTSLLYKSHTGADNPTGLGNMMYELGLDAWQPHNGGNDAVYTMRSMLAICLKDADM